MIQIGMELVYSESQGWKLFIASVSLNIICDVIIQRDKSHFCCESDEYVILA